MKRSTQSIITAFAIIFFSSQYIAQDIRVCEMMGAKLNTIIKKLGKPIHQDRSNKTMECIYYKGKNYQMSFVADEKGTYQAEGYKTYNRKNSAEKKLNNILTECSKDGYKIDTLNQSEFNLSKAFIRMNLSFYSNEDSKKYQIKIKARRTTY